MIVVFYINYYVFYINYYVDLLILYHKPFNPYNFTMNEKEKMHLGMLYDADYDISPYSPAVGNPCIVIGKVNETNGE